MIVTLLRLDCVRLLLECGASALVRNNFGVLARDYVRNEADYMSLFDAALSNQADGQAAADEHAVLLSQSQFNEQAEPTVGVANEGNKRRSTTTTGAKAKKKVMLFGTGMNEEEKKTMQTCASQLNLKISKEMNESGELTKSNNFDQQNQNRIKPYRKQLRMSCSMRATRRPKCVRAHSTT